MNIIPSFVPNATNDPTLAVLDAPYGVTVLSASGAVAVTQGFCPITKAGVAVLTLALPVAGLPSAGGNDGQRLRFLDTGGHAHTITTPSNGINGNKLTATFGGTAAQFLDLTAYNGVWYEGANSGITLS